jgi:hypothetical protein
MPLCSAVSMTAVVNGPSQREMFIMVLNKPDWTNTENELSYPVYFLFTSLAYQKYDNPVIVKKTRSLRKFL